MLQRADQKRIDELRRTKGSLDRGVSTFTESEKNMVVEYTKVLEVMSDEKCKNC